MQPKFTAITEETLAKAIQVAIEKKNPTTNVAWAKSGDDNLFINTLILYEQPDY